VPRLPRTELLVAAPFLLVSYFIILTLDWDFWDGLIIRYMTERNDYQALRDWIFEYTLYLGYPLYRAADAIADGVRLPTKPVISLFYLAFIVVAAWCWGRFIERVATQVKEGWTPVLPDRSRLLIILLFLLFPPFHLIIQSSTLIHVFCLMLFAVGLYAVMARSALVFGLGLVLVALSFQLASLGLLYYSAAPLLILYFLRWGAGDRTARASFARLGVALILPGLMFLLFKLNFRPTGVQQGYNEVQLSFASVRSMVSFGLLIGLLMLPVLGFLAYALLRRRGSAGARPIVARQGLLWAAIVMMMIGGATVPYWLVGKAVLHSYYPEWSHRHAFPLVFPLSLGVLLALRWLELIAAPKVRTLCASALLLLWGGLLTAHTLYWRDRAQTEQVIMASLREPGARIVHRAETPFARSPYAGYYTSYELNYFYYHVFGRTYLITTPEMFEQEAEICALKGRAYICDGVTRDQFRPAVSAAP
jgi:hypothetical protein